MKKSLVSAITVCSIALAAISGPLVATATDEYDDKIQQQDKKINDLTQRESAAQDQIGAVQSEIAEIQTKAEKLIAEQAELNKQVEKLQTEVTDLTKRIDKREKVIENQARSVQVDNNSSNLLSIVMNADSISDAINKAYSANKMVSANKDLVKQQESDKKSVEKKKTETETALVEINENATELEQQKGNLVDKQLELESVKNGIAAEKETEQSKKSEYEQKQKEAEELRKEQARLAEESKKAQEAAAAEAAKQKETSTQTEQQTPEQQTPEQKTPEQTSVPDVNTGVEDENISTPTTPEVETEVSLPTNGNAVVTEAYKHLGKSYVWGAKGPDVFDCSGFTQYVYLQATGKFIGGYTVPQESSGTIISLSQLQPGDLVFWGSRGATTHVGIYVGGGQYIHAPTTGDVVKVTSLSAYTPDFGVRVN